MTQEQVQQQAMDEWWFNQDEQSRRIALAVPPGEPLSQDAVRDLRRYGVRVPSVSLLWDVTGFPKRVRVYAQPPAVRAYLDAKRSA